MAIVTGFTAARMLEIENSCIVNGAVDLSGELQLEKRDGTIINAGRVKGDPGAPGEPGADGIDADLNPIMLGAGVNLDTIDVPGFYWQSLSAQASTALNYPEAAAGWLEISASSTKNQIIQRYTRYDSMFVWTRNRYLGSWGFWKSIPVDRGLWSALSYNGSYKAFNATNYPTGHRQVGSEIHLKGLVAPASGSFPTGVVTGVFTLPASARPPHAKFFVGSQTHTEVKAAVVIQTTGMVDLRITDATTWVSLDGIYFFLD